MPVPSVGVQYCIHQDTQDGQYNHGDGPGAICGSSQQEGQLTTSLSAKDVKESENNKTRASQWVNGSGDIENEETSGFMCGCGRVFRE